MNGASRRLSLGLAHACMQTRAQRALSLSHGQTCATARAPAASTARPGRPICCRTRHSPGGPHRRPDRLLGLPRTAPRRNFGAGQVKFRLGSFLPPDAPAGKWPKEFRNSNDSPFKHMKLYSFSFKKKKLHSFHPFLIANNFSKVNQTNLALKLAFYKKKVYITPNYLGWTNSPPNYKTGFSTP